MRHEEDRDPAPLPRHFRPPSAPAGHSTARRPLPRSTDALPELGSAFWDSLEDGLSRVGVELTPGARAAIDAHARLLLAWNSAINLTALRTPEQVARGHVLDSLSALPLLRRLRKGSGSGVRLLDLGSGGGYPGLPLSVALPVAACALVDSVAKKAAFLDAATAVARAAVETSNAQAPAMTALAERVEDLADEPEHREGWDVVVARAVGSLAEVCELALPLLAVGGHLVAWKRRTPDGSLGQEIRQARPILQAAGGSGVRVEAPPGMADAGLAGHVLVTVRKLRPTPHRYPRSPSERRRSLR